MASTRITRRDQDKKFELPTDEPHIFQLSAFQCHLLEMADVNFHHDSAVLLPDYNLSHLDQGAPVEGKVTAIAVLRACLLHVKEHPDQKLYIAGHTDTTGPAAYNISLSKMRADNVLAALTGDRAGWVKVSNDKNKVEDRQLILKFASKTRGWPCDPGPIDNQDGDQTRAALKEFQKHYNKDLTPKVGPKIGEDGKIGPETWGAFFDVYMEELKASLGVDDAGLKSLRQNLKFLDGARKSVGCGENFPIEGLGKDNFRSAIDRRVEMLFFDPGEEPKLDCHPTPGQCLHKKCELYDKKTFCFKPIDPTPIPGAQGLKITSPGIDDAKKISHGAPVMLNDDHDNGQLFPSPPPAGHFELEPIFDLDRLEDTPAEDDLLLIHLELSPAGQTGNVQFSATEGADRIRIWPKATKGKQADIVTLPASLPTGKFPMDLFVEGIKTGKAVLEATFNAGSAPIKDQITINVVELQESQGGQRRILYDFNSNIKFDVIGAPANYTFEWDLDGDGNFNQGVPEAGKTAASVTIKYGPAAAADTVQLDQTAANTRKSVDVKVRMTGGLVLHVKGTTIVAGAAIPGMRVALGTNQGTALPAQSNAGLQSVFVFSDNAPVTFNATTAAENAQHQASEGIPNNLQGVDRIQFGPLLAGANAVTPRTGVGNGRRVIGVIVGPGIFTSGQVLEDLTATVNHEIKHLQQHQSVRDNNPPNNVWRLLDNFFGGADGYSDLREAEGHLSELQDSNVSWFHQLPAVQNDLNAFTSRYNNSLGVVNGIPAGGTRTAAKIQMQTFYRGIPFFEMKRPGYQNFVRAPQ